MRRKFIKRAAYLLPVIEQVLAQFPFDLQGFHADYGFADVRRRLTKVEHRILGLKRDAVDTAAEIGGH